MNHPLVQDEWGGYEEPEWADEDDSPDTDIIELLGDEDEWGEDEAGWL
jgi:hypothetical protein